MPTSPLTLVLMFEFYALGYLYEHEKYTFYAYYLRACI